MITRRGLFAVPLTAATSFMLFALASRSPFDPIAGYLGDRYLTMSTSDKQRVATELGLDTPWWQQWMTWVGHAATGDLGYSRTYAQPISAVIADRAPWTLLLSGTALVTAIVIALAAGMWAGLHPGGRLDHTIAAAATAVQAVPPFVLSLGAVTVFALTLRWLPVAGLTDPGTDPTLGQVTRHLVLPAVVLTISLLPWLLLSLRQSIRNAAESDAVLGARARGLPEHVVVGRHILPVAVGPFTTVIGLRLPELLVGAAIVEEVFSWPGLAGSVVTAARELDFPLLAALTLGTTLLVLAGSLLADIAHAVLDPRVASDDA
ncbi:ABC transporter permease [Rhodococcus opacus]|uniref:ABC transporter permease n=1 Tax=Rhodococcus opacus TaxID=37919 RepID=A0AAX3YTM3_RHOOP|nr:ABC transporter permease [Rhodococcus opacus]MCZ4590439.1 ABC transporter permease [Rhodococcus opacus]WLF51487.1 ABC transporter permease [Rhodococcus opacus]